MPALAASIMGYGLTFLLTSICVTIGVLVLVLIPICILKILEESGYISKRDVYHLMEKLRLKRKENGENS